LSPKSEARLSVIQLSLSEIGLPNCIS